jgi:hypothetical protein
VSERVKVTGLRELRAHLRAADKKLPKIIGKAGKEAGWLVARVARARVPVGPAKGGHARSSIKPKVTQKGAEVQEGGNKYPYAPWLDFGGTLRIPIRGQLGIVKDYQEIHRSYSRRGRYIWDAFADNKAEVMDFYLDALDRGLREAGLDVR